MRNTAVSQGRDYQFFKQTRRPRTASSDQSFKCAHCGFVVPCTTIVSGVQNRNHCPYCLWSRHLDWSIAGDRLSSCRAVMRPVGLTTKQTRNKYAGERDGELMLIHRCTDCGHLAINRIAADDDSVGLFAVFEESCAAPTAMQADIVRAGIAILTTQDHELLQ